jgi:hypothetical protein
MAALFPAEIYSKVVGGVTDQTLILSTRTQIIYPFEAPGWTDLRVGFLLSVTGAQPADDDPVTGVAENIVMHADGRGPQDRYWIGLKDRGTSLPKNTGTRFVGYSNASGEDATIELVGDSSLSTSDIAVGTANNFFWRPNNSSGFQRSGGIWQDFHPRTLSTDGVQQHFARVPASAGGYATLLALRITRPDPASNTITVRVPHMSFRSADVLFTNTPTLDLLLDNLRNFPTTVQQWGPNGLSAVPDALYCYWPFSNSRLRIHALGIYRQA